MKCCFQHFLQSLFAEPLSIQSNSVQVLKALWEKTQLKGTHSFETAMIQSTFPHQKVSISEPNLLMCQVLFRGVTIWQFAVHASGCPFIGSTWLVGRLGNVSPAIIFSAEGPRCYFVWCFERSPGFFSSHSYTLHVDCSQGDEN